MKPYFLYLSLSVGGATSSAFIIPERVFGWRTIDSTRRASTASVDDQLDFIAHKLKLQIYDVQSGVYGFESKNNDYGIENLRVNVHVEPSLGIELTEVAHSDTKDDRGLVLVSEVTGNAAEDTRVQVGDTIIGVFAGDDFKETTTGYAYDDTVDVISRAKEHALESGSDSISIELNRLVKRSKVKVVVEDEGGEEVASIDALAGDNLRLLLMHHGVDLYDPATHRLDQPSLTGDCGGEGICATCTVAVKNGMESLNKIGPQEESILKGRPEGWRAACKTVVGADNVEGTVLRVGLHPQVHK